MADKQLTAKVKLNIDDVERKIKQLNTLFKTINTATAKANSGNAMERSVKKATESLTEYDKTYRRIKANEAKNARNEYANWWKQELKKQDAIAKSAEKQQAAEQKRIEKINKATEAENRLQKNKEKTATTTDKISSKTEKWVSALGQVRSKLQSSNSALSSIWNKVKGIAATYLGVMGGRAIINASDTITSTENRLNNLPGGNPQLTAESMDKVYAAAQRARSGYSDMLTNVSKTMTLAGDSFGGNIDNAIRFQEIMSKAYTIGGASAAEQASSMYQLVQALGSGVLQGDELKSVREGAPIAYKKIEEFAQGVLNTEESLKDLASQGVITSDIIVAAIMDAEDEINKSFANTKVTFAQTWTNIKNMALKAFEPVLQKLNELLNKPETQEAIQNIGNALVELSNVALVVLDYMVQLINWVADNWDWFKWVVVGVITAMIIWHIAKSAVVIACYLAEMAVGIAANWQVFLAMLGIMVGVVILISGIFALIGVFVAWKTAAIDTCEAIVYALLVVGAVFLILGAIFTGGILAIPGIVMLALAVILQHLGEFIGILFVLGAGLYNFIIGIINSVIQSAWWAVTPIISSVEFMLNACLGGFNSFGDACANLIGQIIGWFLQLGKVVTTIIDAIFGTNWTAGLESLRGKVTAWGKNEKAITLTKEASQINRISYGDAWDKGVSIGNSWKESINSWGSKSQTWDGLSTMLGTSDLSSTENDYLLDPYDPKYSLDGVYDPASANDDINNALDKLNGGVSAIGGNTGKMADSMELAEEDIKYLRQIAEMEWKKEYTTASIKIDMTNNNTVNGESDLDGIVTRLADKLYEEINVVANGVYA